MNSRCREPEAGMPIWKRFWILFTAIWLLIALMNMATVFVFAEKVDAARLLQQVIVVVLVPAALYAVGALRDHVRRRGRPPAAR